MYIYDSEIFLQAMPNKHDPRVDKVADLLVGRLECSEMSGRQVGVQVPGLDPRILGQVIYYLKDIMYGQHANVQIVSYIN